MNSAYASPSFDADFEINTDIKNQSGSNDSSVNGTTYDQNGRVALNIASEHTSGDNFIKSKGTLLVSTDGSTGIDDAFIQLGNDSFDAQFGRFEAINLFPLGKDTIVEHAGGVTVYQGNKVRGRAGDDGGQIALNIKSSDALSFQLATIYGDDDANGDDNTAFSGIRPTVTYATDGMSISAGFEQIKYDGTSSTNDVSQSGFSITANFDVGGANINLSAAKMEDDESKQEVMSWAANMTSGDFGVGIISSNEDNATGDDPSVLTTYAAYTMPLLDIDAASMTLAASYSKADKVAATTNDETIATRLRFNYAF
jgi:hypothetical protein